MVPLGYVNDSVVGFALRVEVVVGGGVGGGGGVDAAATVSLTLTVCGLPVAPVDAMLTVPLYVLGAKPAGFTETLTDPGGAPLVGVADNQVPPEAAAV